MVVASPSQLEDTSVTLGSPVAEEVDSAGPSRAEMIGRDVGTGLELYALLAEWLGTARSNRLLFVSYDWSAILDVDLEPSFSYPEAEALRSRGFQRINDPRVQ